MVGLLVRIEYGGLCAGCRMVKLLELSMDRLSCEELSMDRFACEELELSMGVRDG